jgi:hypothetical protein
MNRRDRLLALFALSNTALGVKIPQTLLVRADQVIQ